MNTDDIVYLMLLQIKLLANDMGRLWRISTEADVVITIGRNKNRSKDFSQEIFHVDLTENYDVDRDDPCELRIADSRVRPAYHDSSICVWY